MAFRFISMRRPLAWLTGLAAALLTFAGSAAAQQDAAQGYGQPYDWQMSLQGAASVTMADSVWFYHYVNYFIIAIVVFVFILLVIVMVRFNSKANPVPSRTTHHTWLEIAWTVLPILVLVAIAIPSFKLLYLQLEIPKSDLTIKVTGNQWNWDVEYPEKGDVSYTVTGLSDEEAAKANKPRLLAVDNETLVPIGKVVHVQVTASDVIHSFTIPSFGIKIDAIPGRLNETWFKATRPGLYYGQCSELCGTKHAYMPIAIRVVEQQEFDNWIKQKSAALETGTSKVAANAAPSIVQ